MCRMSWNLEASASWNPQGLSRPVMGLLLFINEGSSIGTVQFQVCEFSIRGRHKPCAWGMSRFSPHQQTWWGFDYSHHSPWFVQYHINFYDLISTEQDALSWNQLHFQPKDHERDYIPFLKINLFTPAGLCGSQTLIWRQAWHDSDQWQHTCDHMTITCMVFSRPPSYRTSQSNYRRPWNNDHASYIHQCRVLKNHGLRVSRSTFCCHDIPNYKLRKCKPQPHHHILSKKRSNYHENETKMIFHCNFVIHFTQKLHHPQSHRISKCSTTHYSRTAQ